MSEKNRLASTRWEALSKEEKKKFEDISKAYKFPDVAEFSQEEKKNSSIDIGGSYWQRFEKKKKI